MSYPRVFWPSGEPEDGVVWLGGKEAHHLRQVLRVASGDSVSLFDGVRREWVGHVGAVTKQSVQLVGLVSVTPVAEAGVPVTLAMGLLKGDQMDSVVRDATMLGVAAIVPMHTAYVAVPSKAWRSGAARERWQRVAIASASQCGRAVVPEVRQVSDFEVCLQEPAALRLLCAEPGLVAQADEWKSLPPPESVQVLIGPEGGWSVTEVEQAIAAGARVMTLGPRTLRAETAPIVALTVVSAAWGW